MKISVIIPVLDEERRIDRCLGRLAGELGIDETLVVDGGSRDRTVALARARGVTVLETGRGRGRQLNAGAAAATGDVLWFLHADVEAPRGAAASIRRALTDPAVVAGAFRTWTVPERPMRWAPLLHLADLRSRYSRLPYGDQGIFCRRRAFADAGGFPDIPLMEDLAFSRRIRRFGRLAILGESVVVSGRRFESAPVKQTLWVNLFPALHALGVPPALLARLYGNPR